MEGTYDRRHLHRPTPRPVPNRSQMAKKPVTARASQPASQPSVSVSASHTSSQRGMDWVHKTVVKKKTIVREVAVAPVVVEPVLVEPEPIEEALKGPSIAELIAAELSGTPVQSAAAVPAEAHVDEAVIEEPVHQDVHHHATHAHLAGHKLSDQQREVLRRQFKEAITKETKHSTHSETRKHVVERVRHHARKAKSPRTIIAVFLFGVVLSGAYAMIDSFSINQQAHQALAEQAAEAQAQTQEQTTTTTDTTTTSNDTQVPGDASTTPTTKTSATYTVPADQARFIDIPKLGIHAPVISVGLTKDGAIDTPTNIWEAAWYKGSAKPDQAGASFIDAHSSASGGALFGHLDRLVNGDVVKVEKGDGTIITYKVVKVAVVDRNSVDMASLLKPYGDATKGLNLITCQGDWIQSEKTLTNRVEVWTQQQ